MLLFPIALFGQEASQDSDKGKIHPISYFIEGNNSNSSIQKTYNELLSKIVSRKEKARSQQDFVKYVFNVVHTKQLSRYKNYVTLEDIFKKGKYYACVTGTALYAIIFNDLEIPYTIKEFEYHALIIVHLQEGDVLLESTDPLNGFVSDPSEISKRIEFYSEVSDTPKNELQPVASRNGSTGLHKDIQLLDLAGLQYYNTALYHFNNSEILKAVINISKAHALYPSERIKNMRDIIWKFSDENSLAFK